MNLKEKIIEDRNEAMKNQDKNKKLILNTLIGELDRITKTPTDAQVSKEVKRIIEGNIICGNLEENKYLEIYLPKMLDDSELTTAINSIITEKQITDIKSMGIVMKVLAELHPGQYDGKKASEQIKTILISK